MADEMMSLGGAAVPTHQSDGHRTDFECHLRAELQKKTRLAPRLRDPTNG